LNGLEIRLLLLTLGIRQWVHHQRFEAIYFVWSACFCENLRLKNFRCQFHSPISRTIMPSRSSSVTHLLVFL